MKTTHALLVAAVLTAANASPCLAQTQYTTDWVANTFGTDATHVGNAARSMWVAPEGTIYTASMWDEREGGVAIYQGGENKGSIGLHNEFQGSAITGNATFVFAALQYSTAIGGSGFVGRFNRSTQTRDLVIPVSADTSEKRADVVTGLATSGSLLYASDFPGNRVRVYTLDGASQLDIPVSSPGALAVDGAGNLWVAQKDRGMIRKFSPSGALLDTIRMASTSRPSALYYDAPTQDLWVGDEGPDMNIKYYHVTHRPTLAGTFGVRGGYLDTRNGVKGQVGDKRFTRVVGIGKDSTGNLYVLTNPWGGTWDLARHGGTDLHAFDKSGNPIWKLQSLGFEVNGVPGPSPDPVPDAITYGQYFYSSSNIYTGTAGGTFVANTVDPIAYPSDPRLTSTTGDRDENFAQMAFIGRPGKPLNRILVASGQSPAHFFFYHFNKANGYIAIPDGALPNTGTFNTFNTTALVTGGFCLDSNGDVWAGLDGTNQIWHYSLTGFKPDGTPVWGAGAPTAVPTSVQPLTRIIYLPESDTMILAQGLAGSADWSQMGTRIEVYHGWRAGNTSAPNPVINITRATPRSITASANYLFVGYVYSGQSAPSRDVLQDIDAFNLTTGTLDATLNNSNPNGVSVGDDVDSMYSLRSYFNEGTGEYVVTRDNFNDSSIVVYRFHL
jgi:hypothetical protein